MTSALAAERVERNGFDVTGALVPPEEIHPGGPPKDGIPALDRPAFVRAGPAGFVKPGDRVLGVERHGVAKAYPIAILNWHEVVNDRFESDMIGERRVQIEFDRIHRTGRVLDAGGRELPSVIAYWFAWYAFHPDTETYSTP